MVASSSYHPKPDFRIRTRAEQESRRDLWLGLIAGTVVGCLGAFAVISVVPGEAMRRIITATLTNGLTKPAENEPENWHLSSIPDPVRLPRDAPFALPGDQSTHKGTGKSASAEIVPSLRSEPPVMAQGGETKQNGRTPRKKKKFVHHRKRPPYIVERRHRERLNAWAYYNNSTGW